MLSVNTLARAPTKSLLSVNERRKQQEPATLSRLNYNAVRKEEVTWWLGN